MDEIYMRMNMLLTRIDDYVFHEAVETETALAFLIIIDDKITHHFMERNFSVLLSFLSPIRPFLINYAVDNYIMIPDAVQLRFICIVLLSILVLEAIVQFLYIYLATWLGQNVIQDLRAKTRTINYKFHFYFFILKS